MGIIFPSLIYYAHVSLSFFIHLILILFVMFFIIISIHFDCGYLVVNLGKTHKIFKICLILLMELESNQIDKCKFYLNNKKNFKIILLTRNKIYKFKKFLKSVFCLDFYCEGLAEKKATLLDWILACMSDRSYI